MTTASRIPTYNPNRSQGNSQSSTQAPQSPPAAAAASPVNILPAPPIVISHGRQSDDLGSSTGPSSPYSSGPSRLTRSDTMSALSETRRRQNKRDEAIRKKIESDLAKKRGTPKRENSNTGNGVGSGTPSGGRTAGSSRAAAGKQGTVSSLRPTPALTVPQHITVADASQLCAAKRTDCVLVVDDEEHLCGIFTAKDLAFRVVGDGLDPRNTQVQQIMTPNPMVTRDTTSATEALQTMVSRGFRHLPVCNEEGDVVGLLDITKVFHESLEKLERAYGSSQKLYSALEGVQSEWGAGPGGFSGANGLMSYVEALREKMSFPDLGSILDARTRPVTVSVKTSVRDSAKLMREHRTTAVCVMDDITGKLSGIFTSKDIVLRVIAAGLDAKTCSVVRVMTPHPDTGLPTLSIQQALRKMNDGRFLNLPVVEDDGTLVGCVDVLKLTYATLEQVSSIGAEAGGDAPGGPLWSRFFSSFAGQGNDGDTESVVSDSHAPTSSLAPHTPGGPALPKHVRHDSQYGNGSISPSEIHPNDSASVVADEDEASELAKRAGGVGSGSLAAGKRGAAGSAGTSAVATSSQLPADDGTYLFKFLSPSGTTHRFVARYDDFSTVRDIIQGKLASDPFFAQQNATKAVDTGVIADPSEFIVHYTDDDSDLVQMSTNHDLEDSVKTARKQGKDRVLLIIKGGRGWENAIASSSEQQAAEKKRTLLKSVREDHEDDQDEDEDNARDGGDGRRRLFGGNGEDADDDEDDREDGAERSSTVGPRRKAAGGAAGKNGISSSSKAGRSTKSGADDELVFGFLQKDMVLPAAIAFLGVAVIGVFAMSRTSAK